MTVRVPESWNEAFASCAATVFVAGEPGDDWPSVATELTEAFEATRTAATAGRPVVYVVRTDDLLGRRGAGPAMVATGLLSAARTAAVELSKAGVPVNVIAVDADADPAVVARWASHVSEPGGPTGELIHLGPAHIGKALA